MKKSCCSENIKGFTLIELLVVVLIIGILAAIALPQYQRAVEKSRAMEAITILKILRDQQAFCFLEHGIEDGRCAQGGGESNLFTTAEVNITGAPDPDCNYDTCGPSTNNFAFFLDGQYILASRKPFETKYELETTAYPGSVDTNKISCINDGSTNYCKDLGFMEVEEGLWLLP